MRRAKHHRWAKVSDRRQFETRTACLNCDVIRVKRAVPPSERRTKGRRAVTSFLKNGKRHLSLPKCV